MKAFLMWLITVLVNLYEKLFGDDEPIPTVSYEIQVRAGKRGAVREHPNLGNPVIWLLQENESATVGVKDGMLEKVELDSKNIFYYIAFGEKKRGWLKWKEGEMDLIMKSL